MSEKVVYTGRKPNLAKYRYRVEGYDTDESEKPDYVDYSRFRWFAIFTARAWLLGSFMDKTLVIDTHAK